VLIEKIVSKFRWREVNAFSRIGSFSFGYIWNFVALIFVHFEWIFGDITVLHQSMSESNYFGVRNLDKEFEK
jgi:hypothetical protein